MGTYQPRVCSYRGIASHSVASFTRAEITATKYTVTIISAGTQAHSVIPVYGPFEEDKHNHVANGI